MAKDELELGTLSDRKSALFAILSDTDSSFNFVAALMYSQLSNLLCDPEFHLDVPFPICHAAPTPFS